MALPVAAVAAPDAATLFAMVVQGYSNEHIFSQMVELRRELAAVKAHLSQSQAEAVRLRTERNYSREQLGVAQQRVKGLEQQCQQLKADRDFYKQQVLDAEQQMGAG